MATEIIKNQTYYLEIIITDVHGDPVSGKTINYEIRNSSDNSLFDSGTLSEIGTTGIYNKSVIFTAIGQYRVYYQTPFKFDDAIEGILVIEQKAQESTLQSVDTKIDNHTVLLTRIIGLCQENYRLTDTSFNAGGKLTSGKIKIFGSASDCENNINPTDTYQVTAVYNAQNRLENYKVVKQ